MTPILTMILFSLILILEIQWLVREALNPPYMFPSLLKLCWCFLYQCLLLESIWIVQI